MGRPANTPEDFWRRVKIAEPDECWLWQGGVDKDGYGTLRWTMRIVRAHRLAYELLVGPIPENNVVCHSCDNPPCVNPKHLWPGTLRENAHDMVNKNRHGKHERNGRALLTWPAVERIRELYGNGGCTLKDLAGVFGVHISQIQRIVAGRSWLR